MPIQFSVQETWKQLREASLQRSAQAVTPVKTKSQAIVQQLASAAELQLRPDTFSSARALYENALEQVKSDRRLDRALTQQKVKLQPLNNTTPLDWSLERHDVDSAVLLADGPVRLLSKLDLSKPGHRAMLDAVLRVIEADFLAATLGVSTTDAVDALELPASEGVLGTQAQRDQARSSVAKFVNTQGADGRTLLHRQAAAAQADTIETLLRWGADVERPDKLGNTALTTLLNTGSANTSAVLRQFIDFGADLQAPNMDRTSLLDLALRRAPVDAIGMLLDALGGCHSGPVADTVHAWFCNTAGSAIDDRIVQLASTFLANEFDVRKCDQDDGGNVFIAVAFHGAGSPLLLRATLSELPETSPGACKQMIALTERFLYRSSWTDNELELLKIAVEFGMNPNHTYLESAWDGTRRSLMSAAAMRGSLALVKLLVAAGAEYDTPDQSHITPLGWAARRRDRPTYDYLLSMGARDRTSSFCRSHWESPPI